MSQVPYVLRFLAGKTPGVEFPLKDYDRDVIVGRSDAADLMLEDSMVSRRHARFTVLGEELFLEDLGSTNGIFVNAHRVQRTALREGDRIQIGSSLMKLELPQDKPTQPFEPTAEWQSDGVGLVPVTQTEPRDTSRFGGELEEIPMLDLIQLLSSSKKSGLLEVRSVEGYGQVYLRTGQIYYSTIGRAATIRRHKALYRMVAWQTGHFELKPQQEEQNFDDEMIGSTDSMLLEAMRQMDEIARLRELLPPKTLRLVVAKPLPSPDGLTQEHLQVLKIIFNTPKVSVGTILDSSPLSDLETYESLIHLARGRFITVAQGW